MGFQEQYKDQLTSAKHKAAASSDPAPIQETIDDISSDEDSDEDEDGDEITDLKSFKKVSTSRGRRVSVSAKVVSAQALKTHEKTSHAKSDEDRAAIRQRLAECVLFGHLHAAQAKTIVDAVYRKTYEEGQEVITQGDHEAEHFYLVDSGKAEVLKDGKHIRFYDQGGSFGELALMYNAPRAATVVARTPLVVWALDQMTFKAIILSHTISMQERHEQFIQTVPLLSTLTPLEVSKLADALEERTFKAGDVIIRETESGDDFFLIKSGHVECTKVGDDGEAVPVMALSEGDYFGEIALLTNKPRQATCTATSDGITATLKRKTFQKLLGPLSKLMARNLTQYNAVFAGHQV